MAASSSQSRSQFPVTKARPFNKAMVMRQAIEAAFRKNQPRDGTAVPNAGLDGVYLDSLEMSSERAELSPRAFPHCAAVPLVFDREGRPCQLMIFNTWTFERDIAAQMHARGKLMFANAVLWQFAFPAAAARRARHRSQLAAPRRIPARHRRGHELPPRPVPPKALLPADEHRLCQVHAGAGGALFPALPLLWRLARLLRRGSRLERPVLGLREEVV